jgi:hypothetical protein
VDETIEGVTWVVWVVSFVTMGVMGLVALSPLGLTLRSLLAPRYACLVVWWRKISYRIWVWRRRNGL